LSGTHGKGGGKRSNGSSKGGRERETRERGDCESVSCFRTGRPSNNNRPSHIPYYKHSKRLGAPEGECVRDASAMAHKRCLDCRRQNAERRMHLRTPNQTPKQECVRSRASELQSKGARVVIYDTTGVKVGRYTGGMGSSTSTGTSGGSTSMVPVTYGRPPRLTSDFVPLSAPPPRRNNNHRL
jgi:hypothetical protein